MLVAGLALACAGAAGLWIGRGALRPAPRVVEPSAPATLEPQVRAYIQEKVAWAGEKPSDAARHEVLGLVYFANALWGEARASLDNAIRLNSSEPRSHLYRAVAIQKAGDAEAGLAALRQLVHDQPDFAPAQHRLGEALAERGDLDGARTAFRRVIELRPDLPHGHLGMADVHIRNRAYSEAIPLLKRALRTAPSSVMAHYLLGQAYRGLGRMEEAERELALGADGQRSYIPDGWSQTIPEHARGMSDQFVVASRYAASNRADEAIRMMRTLLQWQPDSVDVLNNLATIYIKQRRLDDARALLAHAEQVDPNRFETQINRAACALESGALGEALAYADRSVALAPHIAQAHLTRGRVLYDLQRPEDALAAFEKAHASDPRSATIEVEMGNACIVLGRDADARAHFTTATALAPALATAQLGLCEANIRLRDFEAAHAALETAQRLRPDDVKVRMMSERLAVARLR